MCTHNQCFRAKMKNIIIFHQKINIFIAVKYCCLLHGRVCVMYLNPKLKASRFCGGTAWFVSDLVGKVGNGFANDAPKIKAKSMVIIFEKQTDYRHIVEFT